MPRFRLNKSSGSKNSSCQLVEENVEGFGNREVTFYPDEKSVKINVLI